jgi:hypothetical protein
MKRNICTAIQRACLAVVIIIASGCYSTTARPDGGFKVATAPTFEQRQDFYLWGLVGESHINTQQVCPNGSSQIQSQVTFVDGLLNVITLGIYSPQSARIWCK